MTITGKSSEESGKFSMLLALDSRSKLAPDEIERLKQWLMICLPDAVFTSSSAGLRSKRSTFVFIYDCQAFHKGRHRRELRRRG